MLTENGGINHLDINIEFRPWLDTDGISVIGPILFRFLDYFFLYRALQRVFRSPSDIIS